MINGRSVYALIPARGGSKGLPGKNIKNLAGKPLLQWTVEAAKRSCHIDHVVLSSEDAEIINCARDCGCETPFVRPASLAQDNSSVIDVIEHAIEQLPEFDILVLLQATSPFRHQLHIDQALETYISTNAESCVSVSKPHVSPYWMYTVDSQNHLQALLDAEHSAKQRQALPPVYALNGAIYIISRDHFLQSGKLVGQRCVPYVMDTIHALDIDYALDFYLAETMIAKGLIDIQ